MTEDPEAAADPGADPGAGPSAEAGSGSGAAADPVAGGPAGPDELADPEPSEGAGRGSRVGFIVAGVAAALVVAVVVVFAVLASRPSGYTDATRDRFLASCSADGGPSVEDACRCIYDKLAATVPYDRFADVDQQLRAQLPSTPVGEPLSLPSDVQAIVESCRAVR